MFQDLSLHYFFLIAALLIFYLAGTVVLELIRFRDYRSAQHAIFLKLLVGLTAFIFVYSVAMARFITVNVGFAVIGFMVYRFALRGQLSAQEKTGFRLFRSEKIKDFLPVLLYTLFWYGWLAIPFLNGLNKDCMSIPHNDLLFYSNIASFLNISGQESVFLSYPFFSEDYRGIFPYHYFDLWLTAGFSRITGVLPAFGLVIFSYPLLLVLCSLGMGLLVTFFIKNSWLLYFSPLLLFVSGLMPVDILQPTDGLLHDNPAFYPKNAVLYVFLISYLLCILHKRPPVILLLPLFCLLIAYTTVLPVLVIFICLLLLAGKHAPDNFRVKPVVLLSAGTFLILWFLIHFFKVQAKSALDLTLQDYLEHPLVPLNIAGKTTLQLLILYAGFLLPFLIFLIGDKARIKKFLREPFLFYSILMVVASLAAWMVLYPLFDSIQFFINTGISSLNILVVVLVCYVINQEKRLFIKALNLVPLFLICIVDVYFYAGCPFILPETPVYSRAALLEMKELLENKTIKNTRGAFARLPDEYRSSFDFNERVAPLGNQLSMCFADANLLSISVFDMPMDTDFVLRRRSEIFMEQTPFYHFVMQQKEQKAFISITQSQVDFIRKYDLGYLVTSTKFTLPDTLKSLVQREILDSCSQSRIFILK